MSSLSWTQWAISYFGALAAGLLTFLVAGRVWWAIGAGLAVMMIYIFIQAGRAPAEKPSEPPPTRQLRRQQERRQRKRAGR